MDFLKLEEEKEKKFSKENIIWDDVCYDIWNPVFEDFDLMEEDEFSDNYFKCEVNVNNNNNFNNININNNHNNNLFINKKRKNNKKNNTSNIIINENIGEKKNYKLKVNLLKAKTSNNSLNFKLNQKLGGSQVKSFGSTNSSTIINYDNDCKIKNQNFSCTKDFSNNSQILIHVNTIQEGENFSKILSNRKLFLYF